MKKKIVADRVDFEYDTSDADGKVKLTIPAEDANWSSHQNTDGSTAMHMVEVPLPDLEFFAFSHWRDALIRQVEDLDMTETLDRDKVIEILRRMNSVEGAVGA